MKSDFDAISAIWVLGWLSGVVLANGFWSTIFAVLSGGLWSWYLLLEAIFIRLGML